MLCSEVGHLPGAAIDQGTFEPPHGGLKGHLSSAGLPRGPGTVQGQRLESHFLWQVRSKRQYFLSWGTWGGPLGTSDGSSLAWGALLTRFLPSPWLLADHFPADSPVEPFHPTVGLFVSQLCRLSPVWTSSLHAWTVVL